MWPFRAVVQNNVKTCANYRARLYRPSAAGIFADLLDSDK
jgi:hypothetical protein